MTLKQLSLSPARSDDGASALPGFELAAGGVSEFGQGIGTVICQSVALEPSPQIFDQVQFRAVWRQEVDVDLPLRAGDILAHMSAVVRLAPSHKISSG